MLTEQKKTEALEALNKVDDILKADEDADVDMLCSVGGLISDVYDMETEG